MEGNRRRLPLWVSNLLLFALLSFTTIRYFLWQIHQAEQAFSDHVRVHVKQVAEIIELSARGAVLSQRVAEVTLEALLADYAINLPEECTQ
jgi:hypothetical protein